MRDNLAQTLPSWTEQGWRMLALEVGSAYVQRSLWSIPNSVAAAFPNAFFGRSASSLFLALLLNLCEPVHVCGDHHFDAEIWSRLIRFLRASSVTLL